MQVEQVDFITIPTRDVQRSLAFYRNVPNVTLSFWNPADQGIGNVVILHNRYAPRVPR